MTKLDLNGRAVSVQSPDDTPLLWVIRDEFGLTGTKFGCGIGIIFPRTTEARLRQRIFHRGFDGTCSAGRVVEVHEILRYGPDVGVRHRRKTSMNNRRHRAGSNPVKRGHAVAQIAEKLILGPRDGRRICIRQSGCDPVINHGARIGIFALFGAKQVARRMTTAAMAEAFRQVGAAIPLGAF